MIPHRSVLNTLSMVYNPNHTVANIAMAVMLPVWTQTLILISTVYKALSNPAKTHAKLPAWNECLTVLMCRSCLPVAEH